jgi:DNA-binding CsgD family transcriptional regulator
MGRAVKTVLLYGLVTGLAIAALQVAEYRWLVLTDAASVYAGLVAVVCVGLGLWFGRQLTSPRERVVVERVVERVEVPVAEAGNLPPAAQETVSFEPNAEVLAQLGITPREYDVLLLIAEGLSTRDIAARLFVSENTVKTHVSRVLAKLQATRRTQAVQLARDAGLLP